MIRIDTNLSGYHREEWITHWRGFIASYFNVHVLYDYMNSVVYWYIDPNSEVGELMSTIWEIKKQGVRYTFSPKIRTFFWVDTDFAEKNRKQILAWAEKHKCNVPSKRYMWIECPDDKTVTLFHLTWS